jgi:DNA repair exonuclease SbcCD nuclease subunit
MKIAITADVHLSTYKETPERYHALEDIIRQAISEKVDALLICGDLFNENFNNYSDFEDLAKKYPKCNIWILPGNHDANISSRSIAGKNIRLFEAAEILDDTFQLLFLPYVREKTMGEAIAEKVEALTPGNWVLFGHGDYLEGVRTPNPFETGTYMPLTRTDVHPRLFDHSRSSFRECIRRKTKSQRKVCDG